MVLGYCSEPCSPSKFADPNRQIANALPSIAVEEKSRAHIQLPEGLPGIVGPLTYSPDTAKPLLLLAETLLRGPNTLTSAEREMIAAHVSYRNRC